VARAAVLFTGGKDSVLALNHAVESGLDVCLVTFTPAEPRFLAHPIEFMEKQAQAMNLGYCTMKVGEPFREGYVKAIKTLRDGYDIDLIVTGDIARVEGHPNWMIECSRDAGVDLMMPLWNQDKISLVRDFLSKGFKAVFSLVKKPWLDGDWVGRELDEDALKELVELGESTGLDAAGENGEYHTLVIDGPLFGKRIEIKSFKTNRHEDYSYMDAGEIILHDRP
jgi:diphthine-ammonia ligase